MGVRWQSDYRLERLFAGGRQHRLLMLFTLANCAKIMPSHNGKSLKWVEGKGGRGNSMRIANSCWLTQCEVLLPFAFMKLHQINLHKAHIESNQFSVSGFDKIIQQFDRCQRGGGAAAGGGFCRGNGWRATLHTISSIFFFFFGHPQGNCFAASATLIYRYATK